MVNDAGQLYTMEGVAAGLIMLLTAYIVVSTTSVYTAGDTHIPDMQLEQLGSDVLAMMDTPDAAGGESRLVEFVNENKGPEFKNAFLNYCNATTSGTLDNLHMSANVTYRDDDAIKEHQFVEPDETWTGRESAVRVTRWVQLDYQSSRTHYDKTRAQAVLVEVLLWRV
ncbi:MULTISPECIES: DUF7288 family protein [unclassified Methanoculleus]|mgnify:CR=1 FL=1|jgi:hypothetical protein|uniref:DUF7288 family protein n=1 Tax=unclassified Methanoculleus TaxID=2619537 RepID=UPI0025D40624|nr:hypothetical protein [Methanoculleus sp. UBA377]